MYDKKKKKAASTLLSKQRPAAYEELYGLLLKYHPIIPRGQRDHGAARG